VPWVTLPESTPAFEVYYDSKTLWPAESLERLDAVLAPTSGPTPERSACPTGPCTPLR
jgi:hypothetical protein